MGSTISESAPAPVLPEPALGAGPAGDVLDDDEVAADDDVDGAADDVLGADDELSVAPPALAHPAITRVAASAATARIDCRLVIKPA